MVDKNLLSEIVEDLIRKGYSKEEIVNSLSSSEIGVRKSKIEDIFYAKVKRKSPEIKGKIGERIKVEQKFEVKVGEFQTKEDSKIERKAMPDLGMIVEEITPELARRFGLSEGSGLIVVKVESDSTAAEAGMRPGDIILEVDQIPMKNLEEFHNKTQGYKEGDTVLFLIKRGATTLYLTLKARG